MDYEGMWKQLKGDIQIQEQLSENITISKLINRIKDIESTEKLFSISYKNGNLPF